MADLDKVGKGGVLVLNEDAFTQRNVEKAGYTTDPPGRDARRLPGVQGPDDLDHGAGHRGIGIGKKEAERAKNMFALGLVSWMFGRPPRPR